MVFHDCWKMCLWQYKCDLCTTRHRHILADLCEIYSIIPNMTNGRVQQDQLHCSIFALHQSFRFYLRRLLKIFVQFRMKIHFINAFLLPLTPFATASGHLKNCDNLWYDISMRALIEVEDILNVLYTWVHASWNAFNNCPTRCDLFSLLHFCRQLYIFGCRHPSSEAGTAVITAYDTD